MTIRRLDDSRNLVSYERCPPPPPPRQSQVPSLSTNRISNSEVEEPLIYPPDLGYFGSQNDFRVQNRLKKCLHPVLRSSIRLPLYPSIYLSVPIAFAY
eukprot:TsM_000935900 transcript=TsM_000935900 gene=TsM_000935900